MKSTRRTSAVFLPLLLCASAAACGDDASTSNASGNPGSGGDSSQSTTSGSGGSGATGSGGDSSSTTAQGAAGPGGSGGAGSYDIDESVWSWHQPSLKASLHFGPSDDLEKEVVPLLEKATQSLRLAFFNIRLDSIRDLLIQKAAAGVDVQVVLDKKQQDLDINTMAEELEAGGVPVTLVDNTSATDATVHDKFTVIDGHLTITGSANYSVTALHVSDEDLLTVDNATLAQRYTTEFDELVQGGSADSPPYVAGTKLQAWMGPEDGLYEKVVTELDAAQTHALVAMFQLNTQSIMDSIVAAHERGVTVVVVLDKLQAAPPEATADEELEAAGVPVVLAENTGGMFAEMHSKFLVVDHQRVVMGSYNWTNLGSFYNDENIVVIDDAHLAARAEGKLAELLQAYAAQTPASLGLDTGPQQVQFKVSNVTLGAGVEIEISTESGGIFATPVALNGTSLTTDVDAGTRIEYRYSIKSGNAALAQESGIHAFTVPYAKGPFTVTDAFVP